MAETTKELKTPPGRADEPVAAGPILLSGGTRGIRRDTAMRPVPAHIAAMPGPKRAPGQQLEALIAEVPHDLAVGGQMEFPFSDSRGGGWFLSSHSVAEYVKTAPFRGPPAASGPARNVVAGRDAQPRRGPLPLQFRFNSTPSSATG
jgi:hypothetical protein